MTKKPEKLPEQRVREYENDGKKIRIIYINVKLKATTAYSLSR